MTEEEIKKGIIKSIERFATTATKVAGEHLLITLGYHSNKKANINLEKLKRRASDRNIHFTQWDELRNAELIFQLTNEEVKSGNPLFNVVNEDLIQSYLFFAVELTGKEYSRSMLSRFTRFINRLYDMPVLILFKYDNLLTLSIIKRRLHKRDDSKDVLEKVTLIKDINIEKTNRAHIEILYDLSFDELSRRCDFKNFVELDAAWQLTLDTKELNDKFFENISNWFYWAATRVKFKDNNYHSEVTEDNANYLIKIISRLIFIYFLKERKLIPDDLFYKDKIIPLLAKNEPNESVYYKAILQNLFFGILNTPISNGRFEKLRNKIYISNKAEVNNIFTEIPFVNGGLFEVGDEPYSNSENILTVSDDLFFGKERDVDLSKYFPKRKKVKVEGIVNILNHYKFTIEENTPIEEEIALDPELLGKVFENLLAAIDPQTGNTVRKATGSYYTPREIVDYMVTESLSMFLKSKIENDTLHKWNATDIETKIHNLLSYGFGNPFDTAETERLIVFLDELKILDPACGSGAFPMGLLNKIVFALNKLDPESKKWLELMLDKIPNPTVRREVKAKLEKENWNYIRKLGIIQDTIYGVDILPFAVQISKLRFYISLIVDQKGDNRKENKGIIPLPNLEFKLVCADSLIPLPKEASNLFHDNTSNIQELKEIREEYFRSSGELKNDAINHFKNVQVHVMNEATKGVSKVASLNNNRGYKLASWNPFSDHKTEWFDSEWMFGIDKGFDIVIGNPPYIFSRENLSTEEKRIYKSLYTLTQFKINLYILFIERGYNLLKNNSGSLFFITPNNWMTLNTNSDLRKFLLTNTGDIHVLQNYANVFESASVDTVIIGFRKSGESLLKYFEWIDNKPVLKHEKTSNHYLNNKEFAISDTDASTGSGTNSFESKIKTLEEISAVKNGVQAYTVGEGTPVCTEEMKEKRVYHSNTKKDSNWIKYLDGVDVSRYKLGWSGQYIKYGRNLSRPREAELFVNERILVRQIPSQLPYCIHACFVDEHAINDNNSMIIKIFNEERYNLKFILGILNSSFISFWFAKEFGKLSRKIFPQFKVKELRTFPVPIMPMERQNDFAKVVDYIIFINKSDQNFSTLIYGFYNQLLDLMTLEAFFPDKVKNAGCGVLEIVSEFPSFNSKFSNKMLNEIILGVYKSHSTKNSRITNSLFKLDTLNII
jgi:hypothetical protein